MTKDGETSAPSSEFHPALGVNNIKNAIPLILDRENIQYSNWVELFECHAHAFDVLDHIDPKTPRPKAISDAMWKRLDSVVKNWIYGTISTDLLQTILCKGDTAQNIWDKLKEIFQGNKTTRAVYLENQFNTLHLSNFPDISSYCRQLKNLTDQLANVDQPVSQQKMVIRLVSGLVNTDFDTVSAMIQQTDPLPSFETARSRLLLEESRRAHDNSAPPSSFVAQPTNPTTPTPSPPHHQQQTAGRGGPPANRGRGRVRGRGRGRGRGAGPQSNHPQHHAAPQWTQPIWAAQSPSPHAQWGQAPYPHPQQWSNPRPGYMAPQAPRPPAANFVGPNPQQALFTQGSEYGPTMTPTELGNAFATMGFHNYDPSWYMDYGATSHMTNNAGSSNGESPNQVQ